MTDRSKLHALIRDLPLKEMDPGLLQVAVLTLSEDRGFDMKRVEHALGLALYLHRKQSRSNRAGFPRTPYGEHPLRNALRVLRYTFKPEVLAEYGVKEEDLVIAALLHDTAEDCAVELATVFAGEAPVDKFEARAFALRYLEEQFGEFVRFLVESVSNDFLPEGLTRKEKDVAYFDHVVKVIVDAFVFIIKFVDFVDNAVGLRHNLLGVGNESMVGRLARKYLPLVEVFAARLSESDIRAIVSDEGYLAMLAHIETGRVELPALALLK